VAIQNGTLSDTAGLAAATIGGLGGLIEDSFRQADLPTPTKAVLPTLSDTISTADVASFLAGYNIFESLQLVDQALPSTRYHLGMAELAAFRDALQRGYPFTLAESLTVTTSSIATLGLRIIEQLGVASVLLPSLLYRQSVNERIQLIDSLARFFGAEAADTIDVADLVLGPAYKIGTVDETVAIAPALTPTFLMRVTLNDRVDVSDDDLVQMIFSGWLSDGIDVTAAFLLPGTAFTTWAMNTRTAAVTEYRNYAFNSFARIGNKYLGASDGGLYELLGDDDDGEDIVATIRSGFAQWAGAHLHSFKAAYLAVRGTGDFVLRLITADGRVFNYTVTAESMKTTKVHMGKGLRARYFAFELVSTGQDFDLESLEFIPLAAQRRV
jgi:hypothetical protein